jgi:hypothetical protein
LDKQQLKLPTFHSGNLTLPALLPGDHELMIPYGTVQISPQPGRKKIWFKERVSSICVILAIFMSADWFEHHIGTWLIYVAVFLWCSISFFIRTRLFTIPTHIQIGAEGLRFHQLNIFRLHTTPWIKWNWIASVKYNQNNASPSGQPFIQFHFAWDNVPRDQQPKLRKLLSNPVLKDISKGAPTPGMKLFPSKVSHEADIPRMVSALQHFLDPDKCDLRISEVQGNSERLTYTKFWLDSLESSKARKRDLNPLVAGETLAEGKYKIVKRIGAGGQALTYLAECNDIPSKVVLKEFVLPARGGIEIKRRAFASVENEAALLKQLSHPQIVKLTDLFVDGNRAYLVLEYIDAKSLRHLVQESGIFDEPKVISLATQMCGILQYLHAQCPPVIHRDFTPDNLLLNSDGKLTLVDFNVAERLESEYTKTVVGKHCYIPPEQFRGRATVQSDIYACGATMYWLLTGQDPEPITISHPLSVNSQVSSNMDTIVAKATNPDTRLRYLDADSMRKDLTAQSRISLFPN